MSSSVKRAKNDSPHGVKTADSGKRYVDINDVIRSEIRRIEETQKATGSSGADKSQDNGASRNGNNRDNHT